MLERQSHEIATDGFATHCMHLINPYLDLFRTLEGEPDPLRLAARKKLIWAYSWAVPSPEAIETVASFAPVVEVGAGTGYWAWLLAQAGAKVIALEIDVLKPPRWHELIEGGPEQLVRYDDHALFLCWPPLGESLAVDALKRFKGQRVLYAGEMDGRTGDARFHDALRREFELERLIELPRWPGYRDSLHVFLRREKAAGV